MSDERHTDEREIRRDLEWDRDNFADPNDQGHSFHRRAVYLIAALDVLAAARLLIANPDDLYARGVLRRAVSARPLLPTAVEGAPK